MPNPPKVFISFSRASPSTKALAEKLHTSLKTEFVPFLDERDVDSDEPWHHKITGAMATCGAAILLLTPKIVGRGGTPAPWVLSEATILAFRRNVQPDFKLMAVLMDGLKPTELGPAFDPLKLADNQLRPDKRGLLKSLTADLKDHFQDWGVRQPDELRELGIRVLLKDLDHTLLEDVANRLSMPERKWKLDASWSEFLARHIALQFLGEDPIDVANILTTELTGHLDPSEMQSIVERVAASWVPRLAGLRLHQAVEPDRESRTGRALELVAAPLALSASVELYASRASGKPCKWKVIGTLDTHGGERAFEDLKADIEEAMKRKLGRRKQRRWGLRPWLVTLAQNSVLPDDLERLRADFPSCTFVVYDPDIDSDWTDDVPAACLLAPAPVDEEIFLEDLSDAVERVNPTS